ncbi:ATP-binding cassette domain-containing protein [Erythrobacter sp. YT30]|uniref:ATP-binding cassette domain-containing protein n=1 Tax=Erythrobacter sp. YT30 TaxID=1735012 RepID=UPI00076CBE09|nr:ATP-binding cassette domain-containing protein [Erythrobacter sp. YT30]KWV91760.1 hypothetical protein AUC45_11185 [Erythrobacter sp. YT30]
MTRRKDHTDKVGNVAIALQRIAWQELRSLAIKIGATVLLMGALFAFLEAKFGFPNLIGIVSSIREQWVLGELQHDIAVTSARWLLGWSIGAPLGIAIGLLTGLSRALRYVFEASLTMLRSVPFIALVPVSIVIFGFDEIGKTSIIAWAVFFVCWLATHQSALSVPPEDIWRAKSLGLGPMARLRIVISTHISSSLFIALRTSLLIALIVVAVAELTGSTERPVFGDAPFWTEGLGYRIFEANDRARYDILLSSIAMFSILGVVGERAFVTLWHMLNHTLRWETRRRSRNAFAGNTDQFSETEIAQTEQLDDGAGIRFSDLAIGYADRLIVSNLSLDVKPGEIICVLGQSGIGKTSLLKAAAGIPAEGLWTRGEIKIGTQSHASPEQVSLVLQDAPVFRTLTVSQNLALANQGKSTDEIVARVQFALKRFRLEPVAHNLGSQLSGGQRQRLALATAYLNSHAFLFCDEPNASLDAFQRRLIQDLFIDTIKFGSRRTTLWITHDVDEALRLADRILVLSGSRHGILELPSHTDHDTAGWEFSDEYFQMRRSIFEMIELD